MYITHTLQELDNRNIENYMNIIIHYIDSITIEDYVNMNTENIQYNTSITERTGQIYQKKSRRYITQVIYYT